MHLCTKSINPEISASNSICNLVSLSNIRLSKVSETLDRLALESERVRFETISIVDYEKLPAILDEFAQTIDKVGYNPFKGW